MPKAARDRKLVMVPDIQGTSMSNMNSDKYFDMVRTYCQHQGLEAMREHRPDLNVMPTTKTSIHNYQPNKHAAATHALVDVMLASCGWLVHGRTVRNVKSNQHKTKNRKVITWQWRMRLPLWQTETVCRLVRTYYVDKIRRSTESLDIYKKDWPILTIHPVLYMMCTFFGLSDSVFGTIWMTKLDKNMPAKILSLKGMRHLLVQHWGLLIGGKDTHHLNKCNNVNIVHTFITMLTYTVALEAHMHAPHVYAEPVRPVRNDQGWFPIDHTTSMLRPAIQSPLYPISHSTYEMPIEFEVKDQAPPLIAVTGKIKYGDGGHTLFHMRGLDPVYHHYNCIVPGHNADDRNLMGLREPVHTSTSPAPGSPHKKKLVMDRTNFKHVAILSGYSSGPLVNAAFVPCTMGQSTTTPTVHADFSTLLLDPPSPLLLTSSSEDESSSFSFSLYDELDVPSPIPLDIFDFTKGPRENDDDLFSYLAAPPPSPVTPNLEADNNAAFMPFSFDPIVGLHKPIY